MVWYRMYCIDVWPYEQGGGVESLDFDSYRFLRSFQLLGEAQREREHKVRDGGWWMILVWFRLVSALFDEAGPLVGEVFQETFQTGNETRKKRFEQITAQAIRNLLANHGGVFGEYRRPTTLQHPPPLLFPSRPVIPSASADRRPSRTATSGLSLAPIA